MDRPNLILVLNSGSSSLKYQLVDIDDPANRRRGLVERIGEPGAVPDYRDAVARVLAELPDPGAVDAVGHRVVHGGSLTEPTVIDDSVIAIIEQSAPLAPLHNPPNLAGILAAREALPTVPQVAVFDTAFHAQLPPAAATYAIDRRVAQRLRIRRYGFHGTSHRYVAERTARLLGRPVTELNTIVLHLGNGASAAAVAGGRSVDTSMGLSPLEGLVMGTRCGDIDPGVLLYLLRSGEFGLDDLDDLLDHHSGLMGLCGHRDMRDVLQRRSAGDPDAILAFDVYCGRLRKYVGAYHAVLGRLDAIAFTAGVGENSAEVRAASLAGLQMWGIEVDPHRNTTGAGARLISPVGAAVAVCVVPTDEEAEIAAEVADLLASR